jgi:hypothetical protein
LLKLSLSILRPLLLQANSILTGPLPSLSGRLTILVGPLTSLLLTLLLALLFLCCRSRLVLLLSLSLLL